MARSGFLRLAALAAVALVGALGVIGAAAAPPAEADAGAVIQWNAIALNTLAGLPQPAGGAAPSSQINVGMVQGAVYDAVNAITPKHHRPYLLQRILPPCQAHLLLPPEQEAAVLEGIDLFDSVAMRTSR